MQNLLLAHPLFYWLLAFTVGAMIGSFLNVVIYRLPRMLQQQWRAECYDYLQLTPSTAAQHLNLAWPRSHCPHCQQALRYWHNIPLLSYLMLRGKCAHCQQAITWRYPLVELLTATFTAWIVVHYGFSLIMGSTLLITWSFITLTFIDFEHQLLPDDITLPLLWFALLINSFGLFTDLKAAVLGAVVGYLSLWSIAKLFELITGKVGMGHGDFKLLAVIGALLGWQILPLIILLASLLGSIVGISSVVIKKRGYGTPISFGPYLAIAGWLGLVFNAQFLVVYHHLLF